MKRNKGFTLIELIVVIAILAILALLIVPQVTGYVEQSQKVTCDTNRSTLERELLMKNMTDSNNYPVNATGYQKLIEDHGGNVECPAGGTYSWYATGDNSGYIVCSKHGHGDAIGSNVTTGGTDTSGTTGSDGKSIVVTDTSGKIHTITATYTDWSKVSALINTDSGWTISNGTTFSDGTSVYVYADYPNNYNNKNNISNWNDLITSANLVKISSQSKVYDSSDLSSDQPDNYYFTNVVPDKGALYYNSNDDKLYVLAQNCYNKYCSPINGGRWSVIK